MKKGFCTLFIMSLFLVFTLGCSEKPGEKEYFDKAYQHMGEEEWSKAEENFKKILDEYPDGTYSSKALFMVGFINANYLNNYDKAKEYYSDFLEKYPNHDLADDAKYEIENLGKNIDELPFLQEEKSSEDSISASKPEKVSTVSN